MCVFMMLANGDKPFEGKTPKQVVAKVLLGDVRFEGSLWEDISSEAKDFIKKLLRVDPEERLTANRAIYDPWFSSQAVAVSGSPRCRQELVEKVQQGIVEYADAGEFRKLALNVIAKKSTCEEIFELRKGEILVFFCFLNRFFFSASILLHYPSSHKLNLIPLSVSDVSFRRVRYP
mgnify:CR=1 FL=1